jgi:hypothetical protein
VDGHGWVPLAERVATLNQMRAARVQRSARRVLFRRLASKP